MPECLMVDRKLLKDINSRRLKDKGYIHGKGQIHSEGICLHIFLCMVAQVSVQPDATVLTSSPSMIYCPKYKTFNHKRKKNGTKT